MRSFAISGISGNQPWNFFASQNDPGGFDVSRASCRSFKDTAHARTFVQTRSQFPIRPRLFEREKSELPEAPASDLGRIPVPAKKLGLRSANRMLKREQIVAHFDWIDNCSFGGW